MDPVAERIAAIIEAKGYSYSAFAKEVGVQRANISHVISGRNRPSLELVQRILRRFPDLDSDQLLFGASPKEREPQEEKGALKDPKEGDVPPSEKRVNKRVERVVVCYVDGTFASYEADG